MGLSFNEEIQSSYYQNTSVSVEGASVEWVDEADVKHTRYFGHWSDDSKQDASATTHNMQSELCIDGYATQLIDELEMGGTVWKGTDGAVYHIAAVSQFTARGCYRPNWRLQSMHR